MKTYKLENVELSKPLPYAQGPAFTGRVNGREFVFFRYKEETYLDVKGVGWVRPRDPLHKFIANAVRLIE